jgi:hypothetical protein
MGFPVSSGSFEGTATVRRQDIRKRLAAHAEELRQLGVTSLALFGSAARNESSLESDVDLLVEFGRPVGLFHFFSVQHRLEQILDVKKVDLVQRGALHPALRDHILAEAIHVAYCQRKSYQRLSPRLPQKL